MLKNSDFERTYIATATTTQIATGRGVLHSIVVGTSAAGSITVYDETGSGTTVIIGVLKSGIAEGTYLFDCSFSKGLKIVTAAASLITVTWAQD